MLVLQTVKYDGWKWKRKTRKIIEKSRENSQTFKRLIKVRTAVGRMTLHANMYVCSQTPLAVLVS